MRRVTVKPDNTLELFVLFSSNYNPDFCAGAEQRLTPRTGPASKGFEALSVFGPSYCLIIIAVLSAFRLHPRFPRSTPVVLAMDCSPCSYDWLGSTLSSIQTFGTFPGHQG